jgi:DNA (cytosine-5)-methyltransferase 1
MGLRVLDLFCGAGGFSHGFSSIVPGTYLAIDKDPFALSTYRLNHPGATVLRGDISTLHSSKVERLLGGTPDVILASPPCEEYSLANPDSARPASERVYGSGTASLLLDAIRLIGDLAPSVFIIENVAALLKEGGKQIVEDELSRVGIDSLYINLVRAHEHGNPSKRLRVFFSNVRLKLPRSQPPSVMACIGDLPPLGLDTLFSPHNNVPNHDLRIIPEDKLKEVRRAKRGRGVKHFRTSKNKALPNWVRLYPNQVATSIIGLSRYIHPLEDRLLTVREHARLMSYPDSFVFLGPPDSQYNQVGESVPPLVSRLIAEEVKHSIV